MSHVENLKESIHRNDPEQFLADYLRLILQGSSLALPQTIELNAAKMQWRDAIPIVCGNPTDTFITNLSTLWAEIVQEHGGVRGESLPQDLLNLLLKRENTVKKLDQSDIPQHSIQRVTPSISSDYTKLENARKKPLRSKKECVENAANALHQSDESRFLIAYLELNVLAKTQKLPKTSISGKIFEFWKNQIQETFKKKMPDTFLEKLTGLWINITAKKGLPTTDYLVAELLYHCRAHYEKPIATKTIKNETLFKKLLNRFF